MVTASTRQQLLTQLDETVADLIESCRKLSV